jgi:hypothetical protein
MYEDFVFVTVNFETQYLFFLSLLLTPSGPATKAFFRILFVRTP